MSKRAMAVAAAASVTVLAAFLVISQVVVRRTQVSGYRSMAHPNWPIMPAAPSPRLAQYPMADGTVWVDDTHFDYGTNEAPWPAQVSQGHWSGTNVWINTNAVLEHPLEAGLALLHLSERDEAEQKTHPEKQDPWRQWEQSRNIVLSLLTNWNYTNGTLVPK